MYYTHNTQILVRLDQKKRVAWSRGHFWKWENQLVGSSLHKCFCLFQRWLPFLTHFTLHINPPHNPISLPYHSPHHRLSLSLWISHLIPLEASRDSWGIKGVSSGIFVEFIILVSCYKWRGAFCFEGNVVWLEDTACWSINFTYSLIDLASEWWITIYGFSLFGVVGPGFIPPNILLPWRFIEAAACSGLLCFSFFGLFLLICTI